MPVNNALIIAVSDDIKASLSLMLSEIGITDISATSGNSLRELLSEKSYGLILLVMPLENGLGLETARYISEFTQSALVIFTPSKVYEEVCGKLSSISANILPKNTPDCIMKSTIRSALHVKEQLDELRCENEALRKTVNEMKLVNRAKCVLIEYLRISEKEAHRQIQKRAMDRRTTLTEVAADIIKTYEYL